MQEFDLIRTKPIIVQLVLDCPRSQKLVYILQNVVKIMHKRFKKLKRRTLRCLIKGYTHLFNFRNFDTLPSLIRVYPLIKFWKSFQPPRFSLPYAYPFSRKCLPYLFIRHISTLPVYLIFKNIPLYPLIRVYPFIRHLRVKLNCFIRKILQLLLIVEMSCRGSYYVVTKKT